MSDSVPSYAGTNIDDAIKTGSTLLRDYLSGPDANPNRVSLLIFLTDGQPTVGEKQPIVILRNNEEPHNLLVI